MMLPAADSSLPATASGSSSAPAAPSTAAASGGWQGKLELTFVRQSQHTQLARRFVQAPMKVQRPFYPEGDVCHAVTLHTAGGIVGGDRLTTRLHLHPDAHALLTTAAAGKIYRSNGPTAHHHLRVQLEAGACLEWLPQAVIAFDGAQFTQDMQVELAEGALWLGWDIVRLGRTARGEQFLSGEWRSRTQIWQNGRLLWVDPQRFQGGSTMLHHPHGLADCPVVGSFAIVGRAVPTAVVTQARDLWQTRTRPPQTPADAGVTQLMQGMLCRYRGHSTLEAHRWFRAVWQQVRLALCDRPACPPRVW